MLPDAFVTYVPDCTSRMVRLLIVALPFCVPSLSLLGAQTRSTFEYERRVGLVVTSQQRTHCLAMEFPILKDGQRVVLADPRDSAAVVDAIVEGTHATLCPVDEMSYTPHLYAVRVLGGVRPQPGSVWYGIAVAPGLLRARGEGEVLGDLDGDGVEESLRTCTSMEGLHFTIWTGTSVSGMRRWHRYFPLHYDVEPSCTERETLDPGAERSNDGW
jgi:hypothetical protein